MFFAVIILQFPQILLYRKIFYSKKSSCLPNGFIVAAISFSPHQDHSSIVGLFLFIPLLWIKFDRFFLYPHAYSTTSTHTFPCGKVFLNSFRVLWIIFIIPLQPIRISDIIFVFSLLITLSTGCVYPQTVDNLWIVYSACEYEFVHNTWILSKTHIYSLLYIFLG